MLDLKGAELWRARVEPPSGLNRPERRMAGYRAETVVDEAYVLMRNHWGDIAAYDVKKRAIAWHKQAASGYRASATADGTLFLARKGACDTVDVRDGRVSREVLVGDGRVIPEVVGRTLVVAYEAEAVAAFRAFDLSTLERKWDLPAPEVLGTRDIKVSNVFVGTRSDMFMWYGSAGGKAVLAGHALKDGSLIWATEGVSFPHGPFVHEGKIPILSKEFRIFDENTGKLLATGVNHGTIYEKQGCVVKNMVVFTDEFGRIICYDVTTGENLGRDRVMEDRRKRQGGSFYGSMAVGDRVYIPDGWGNIWIYRAP